MDNNLGFRVKRRRFIIETVNGDGPVGGDEPKKPRNPAVEEAKAKAPTVEHTGQLRPVKTTDPVVRFAGEKDVAGKGPRANATIHSSVSKVIHANPEMYEF